MKKSLGLSLAAATLLAGNAFAMDLAGGTLTGDVRAAYHGHATSEYDDASGTTHDSEDVNALGLGINPTFSMEVMPNLSVEVGAGIAVPVMESDDGAAGHMALGKNDVKVDPVTGVETAEASEMYALLNKYNVTYGFGDGFVKVGAQNLDTPFAGSDDIRLVPNTFTAAVVGYTGVKNFTFILADVMSMAGAVDSNSEEDGYAYNSMSDAAVGGIFGNDEVDDKDVQAIAAVYNNEEAAANGQFWYYMMGDTGAEVGAGTPVADDLGAVSAMYLDAGMDLGVANVSAQYMTFASGLWSNAAMGLMADASFGDIGVTAAYNSYSYTDNGYQDAAGDPTAVHAPAWYYWGGYPEYAVADEKWAGDADWDGGTSTKLAVSYTGVEHLDASLALVTFSDVASVTDIVLGYGVAENIHAGFVYEMVTDETDAGPDETITKLHVSYTF